MNVTLDLSEDVAEQLKNMPEKDDFVDGVLKQHLMVTHKYTQEQLDFLDESLASANRGEFASDEEVEKFFEKYG